MVDGVGGLPSPCAKACTWKMPMLCGCSASPPRTSSAVQQVWYAAQRTSTWYRWVAGGGGAEFGWGWARELDVPAT